MQMENKLEYTDDLFVRTNKKYKEEVSVARHSVWRDIKKELLSNKIAVICLVILCVIIIASFLAPLSPYDPNVIDVTHKLEGPSSAHWFGTDDYGRDYFAVKHIVPNIMGPVTVAASLGVANAILTESSLSFLGLGVQIPQASWGSMLQEAQSHIMDTPMLAIYPGVLILFTVLSFNLLGDVLRTALEPKIVK